MKKPTPPGSWKEEIAWGSVRTLVIVFSAILIFRAVIFQPFYIPSGSMIPSLLIGDNLFVAKWPYGFSRYSFPLGHHFNYFSGRILNKTPDLGDVVVFRAVSQPGQDFIKRVVGLPGDTIQMIEGKLHINGYACPIEKIQDATYYDDSGKDIQSAQYIETLPNGVEHLIIKKLRFGEGYYDNTDEYVVPPGHYFMVGDNRDGSNDSRAQDVIGYVPEENLVGRASFIFFSTGSHAQLWEIWRWIAKAHYDRVMTWVN